MGLSREEFEKRRAERRKATSPEAREEQMAIDREAIDAIEVEKDVELDVSLSVQHFVAGCPVLLGIKRPDESQWKRFSQSVMRAKDNADAKVSAVEQMGRVCWLYPSDDDARKALIAANPALIAQVGARAVKLAELHEEAEGKG